MGNLVIGKTNQLINQSTNYYPAVRVGFEPTVHFRVRQFSKLFLSATQAPHQKGGKRTLFFQFNHNKIQKRSTFLLPFYCSFSFLSSCVKKNSPEKYHRRKQVTLTGPYHDA